VRDDFACFQVFLMNFGIFICTPRRGTIWGQHMAYCGAPMRIFTCAYLPNGLARLISHNLKKGKLKEATSSHRLQCWSNVHGIVVHFIFCLL
jgi:hypothetical protein